MNHLVPYWWNLRKRWKIPQVKHVTPSLSYSNVTYHGRDALCTNALPCRSDMSDFESVYSLQFTVYNLQLTIFSKIMMMFVYQEQWAAGVRSDEGGGHTQGGVQPCTAGIPPPHSLCCHSGDSYWLRNIKMCQYLKYIWVLISYRERHRKHTFPPFHLLWQ